MKSQINFSGVSIIICCYNSSSRLPHTLKYLADQEWADKIPKEIIVVDNASNDDTKSAALNAWQTFSTDIILRVVDEPVPGLSNARKKGVDESMYDIVIFCDDDNWLNKDFIRNAFDLMYLFPSAAVIGGDGIPFFEKEVDQNWFQKHEGIYAVGKQGKAEGDITEKRGFVFGAASVWRRMVLKKIFKNTLLLTDRVGTKLSSAGDIELCFRAIIEGYKIFYSPKLIYTHFLPSERLCKKYVKKFLEDSTPNSFYLHGLIYKAGIQKTMFDAKLKRTWWGQLLILFKNYLLKRNFSIKLLALQVKELVVLNKNYDKSFQ